MMKIAFRLSAPLLGAVMLLAGWPAASTGQPSKPHKPVYIPYEDARPIIEALAEIAPAELKSSRPGDVATAWPNWVARRDAEVRSRLVQGDEDSLVNFMLFGTSFTRRPRVTLSDLARAEQKADSPEAMAFLESIKARAADLVQAIATPGANERLLFARRFVEARGYNAKNDPEGLKQYLLKNLSRVLNEQASYARMLESARLLGDPSEEFAERSKLFRNRGLSSDTSLMPNFAIDRSLASLKAKGLLSPKSVRRVAVIGPGLDFTDKQDGYDFYPQQTIQPFAVIDSLLRLGLAAPGDLQVATLDISTRINDHLNGARARAARGISYVVQLPRDTRWNSELGEYWLKFGNQIGEQAIPAAVPAALRDTKVRAVKIRPNVVSLISPEDLNIVVQRFDLPAAERFDLMIATNILVYYDVFEQSFALANIEKLLRPGGFLLSNNALLELPQSRVHSVGYETVVYSDRANDGDHIVWYQRAGDS